MQLGPYSIQIFTSLVLILGAAFVALICDFLKGKNEQLRELAIELNVRREEERRRFQMLAPHTDTVTRAVPQKAEKAVSKAVVAPAARSLANPSLAKPSLAKPSLAKSSLANPSLANPGEKKRALAPEALAAMERGAQLAGAPRARRPQAEPSPVQVISPAEVISSAQVISPAEVISPVEAITPAEVISPYEVISRVVAAAAASARVGPKIRIRVAAPAQQPTRTNRDWGALLTGRRSESVANDSPANMIAAQAAEPVLPAGFQDGYVLTRLVESHQPVSGLVVSIGVSAPDGQDGSMPGSVRELIQSLIGPNDFAAQSGEEEFLLIYPGERGADAQRRLSTVAQQLWDFQLRSLGSYSILFSWGGVEVRSESIKEAIASATERMQETRRGRKILTMESRPSTEAPVRRAV